ncbi:acyl-CoA reductase [Dyella flagellata]|uniref:long-chain-fatty-acyl-CoA reductase n=1 Tax=Dyella flagellata TaxID=1867833 RepID=A0ABQ5XA41_9GAMM|nr:acyl-CoA reductase [Dyella flagellata]GLQ88540.1 hypothetical protein GCM10007898_21100 [Dyella flagellata]
MTGNYISLIPNARSLEQLASTSVLFPFSDEALQFVDALSASLFLSPDSRAYPEILALAFWMRKANLVRLKQQMQQRNGDALLVPRGTVFHIAPSNVDTIFVYSWFLSLLCGNRNIIRLSSRSSAQTEILLSAIAKLLSAAEYTNIAERNLLVRYGRDDQVTTLLSSVCDVRVVWGGNATVQEIRRIPLPATSTEVAFANKYSLALISADAWLAADEPTRSKWTKGFYNDAYWFGQMACSSPRLIVWLGEATVARRAADQFWREVARLLSSSKTGFTDADYVNKLVASDALAMESTVSILQSHDNNIVRVWLDAPALHEERHCGGGLFFECAICQMKDLRPLLNRTVQTVSYAGISAEEIKDFVRSAPLAGIDRWVPMGRALDFSPVWDGFDLLRVLMREITVD